MASSSKGRASSGKQSSAGQARVIARKRKDALPRTGTVSEGRRKAIVLPPIDLPTEPPATVVAAPNKKARSPQRKKPTASRKKTTAPEPVAETVVGETELEVEASAIVEELPADAESAPHIAIGPPPIPEERRAPPLARTTAASPAPAAPAPRHAKPALLPVISRLLSTFGRWTGVRW